MMILFNFFSINYLICNIIVVNRTKKEREIFGGMLRGPKKLEA